MSPKIIFVTGANTGLGLEVIKSLCRSAQPYNILLGCRTLSKGEAAIEEIKKGNPSTSSTLQTLQVDLSSDESLQKAIDTISNQHSRLDILVNNAGGIYNVESATGASSIREAWNKTWDTNVSGTQVLTNLAVPLLLKSNDPRLVFMTSGTASLTETELSGSTEALKRLNANPPKGWPKDPMMLGSPAYRSSKTGLNMLMREWTRVLKNDGVKVWCISPGFLATNLGGMGSERLTKV